MAESAQEHMQCMEVWGGTQFMSRAVEMGGLETWVYSKPFGGAGQGGDVYYASSCATGRIARLLLADVSGHGDAVATTATELRNLMRRYVNYLDQTELVRSLNRQFSAMSKKGGFATAIATTFFAPNRRLSVCNAGHPRPFLYSASTGQWTKLERSRSEASLNSNIPLGIDEIVDYEQFHVDLEVGDLVVCYTDALIESRDVDGEFFGEEGLMKLLIEEDAKKPETIVQSLLARIAERYAGNLKEDDVTLLVLRATGRGPQVTFGEKFGALARMFGALVKSINPRAERAPLPDLVLANIGGAIIPRLGKRWRGKR